MKMKCLKWSMLTMLLMSLGLTSCSEDVEDGPVVCPPVEPSVPEEEDTWFDGIVLDAPKGGFQTPRCKVLTVVPVVNDGKTYDFRWMMGDSILSREKDLEFISMQEGTVELMLQAMEQGHPDKMGKKVVKVQVVKEKEAYTPYITSVLDYRPAPGQFVNELPEYKTGDTQKEMNDKVLARIGHNAGSLVTLGGFGGYVVCGFDHTIVNVLGAYDFRVLGNAFPAAANPNPDATREACSSEPGIVMVAYDRNQNGEPDADEWYELAGSEYSRDETLKGYSITYFRPDKNHVPVAAPEDEKSWNLDAEYIRWKDSEHQVGFIPMNTFHQQNYYPNWIKENVITFKGTRLANNAVNESQDPKSPYWLLYAFDWGYADNFPNRDERAGFKIEWAVDKKGNPVHLPGVDFIKVYTGVNQCAGWIGETSTEIMGIDDLHLLQK